ncbi:MAG TPA: endonuclease/exonuclease/phosphatase family protein [Armatimonadota bacterium]|jgi:endonuclease/exonuclease/phosphatase family metal-dependent hydrolase
MSESKLTLVTYNIHHAAGMDRRISIPRVSGVLKDTDADVVCLQEVDCRVVRSRRSHQPRLLAKALGMKAVFGATLKWPLGAGYGNLALSRLPLIAAHTHHLPLGEEPRGIVEMHVQAPFGPIAIFGTHWGLSEEERAEQAEATARFIRHAKLPALLAGDLNEGPDGRAHAVLTAAGLTRLGTSDPTFPADDPAACIDHVYGTQQWRVEETYAIPSLASDHRPVVVELRFVQGV